ncbi:MAG: amidoligase family protein [Bdellovibrionota bacterium]
MAGRTQCLTWKYAELQILDTISEERSGKALYATTVGIEIEGSIPISLTYGELAAGIAKRIEEVLPGSRPKIKEMESGLEDAGDFADEAGRVTRRVGIVPQQAFEVQFAYLGSERTIKIINDSSVKNFPAKHGPRQCVEVVSPVIGSPEELALFGEIFQVLKNAGYRPETTAGLHVHVGFSDAQVPEVVTLLSLFRKVDAELRVFWKTLASRGEYIESLPLVVKSQADLEAEGLSEFKTIPDFLGWFAQVRMGGGVRTALQVRRVMVNPIALQKHGTMESRYFNSTQHWQVIEDAVDFSGKFVSAVREGSPRLRELLALTRGNPSFDALSIAIGANISDPARKRALMAALKDDLVTMGVRFSDRERAVRLAIGVSALGIGYGTWYYHQRPNSKKSKQSQ